MMPGKRILLTVIILPIAAQIMAQVPVKLYYDSLTKKKIRAEFSYNNAEDSLMEGPYKSYHVNGRIAMTGQYANGKKNGAFLEYFPNGKKRLEANFLEGKKRWSNAGL